MLGAGLCPLVVVLLLELQSDPARKSGLERVTSYLASVAHVLSRRPTCGPTCARPHGKAGSRARRTL